MEARLKHLCVPAKNPFDMNVEEVRLYVSDVREAFRENPIVWKGIARRHQIFFAFHGALKTHIPLGLSYFLKESGCRASYHAVDGIPAVDIEGITEERLNKLLSEFLPKCLAGVKDSDLYLDLPADQIPSWEM